MSAWRTASSTLALRPLQPLVDQLHEHQIVQEELRLSTLHHLFCAVLSAVEEFLLGLSLGNVCRVLLQHQAIVEVRQVELPRQQNSGALKHLTELFQVLGQDGDRHL